jgi:hypothetical protein
MRLVDNLIPRARLQFNECWYKSTIMSFYLEFWHRWNDCPWSSCGWRKICGFVHGCYTAETSSRECRYVRRWSWKETSSPVHVPAWLAVHQSPLMNRISKVSELNFCYHGWIMSLCVLVGVVSGGNLLYAIEAFHFVTFISSNTSCSFGSHIIDWNS